MQEATWRSEYDTVVERMLAGKKTLYGTGRHVGGDGWPGTSYFIQDVGIINLSVQTVDANDPGLKNAEAIVQTLTWN